MTNIVSSASPSAMVAKVQVEGIQSVMPLKPTEPRQTRKVVLKRPQTMGIFQKCHHILLYYKKATADDSGWVVAGRFKESIGRSMMDFPMIPGRLRWAVENGSNNNSESCGPQRELELVANDSGIRLVEATFPMSLDGFLEIKVRKEAEAGLVYWEDINEDDPQFCPLTFIQVTNFQCGGYAIGFSLSLVLGDPLELTSFLKHTAKLHNEMFKENKAPVFYLPKLKTGKFLPMPNNLSNKKQGGQTLLYNVNAEKLDKDKTATLESLALLCIQDAERKLGVNMDLDFALFVKDGETSDLTVEVSSKGGLVSSPMSSTSSRILTSTEWGEANLGEISLWEAHKPTHVAYWSGLRAGEGLVMVNLSRVQGNSGVMDVIVTIPHGN